MSPLETRRLRVPLRPPQAVANTSAVLWCPRDDTGRAGLVLGHGAGTDLSDPVLLAVGRGLADRGHPVLSFNFSYAEAGRKPPDPPARLESAFRDAIAAGREAMGDRAIVLGGRSMGGRIASHLAAQGEPCAGLVLLAYPLHAARRPDRLRTGHWGDLRVPVLFLQGDRDPLCDLDLLERERAARLADTDARVHVVAGADHAFAVRKKDGRSPGVVLEEIVAAMGEWLDEVPARAREAL
ncbi:MAG TPA: alpha/beta fold hydrolase [Egibacteraceae bacterium]|nr:alpha/beta fold hydrolase [Egibacteraceae bacterium]